MRALCYLEWRYALHAIAAIRRSPARLALWVPYLLLLAFTLFSRVHGKHYGVGDVAGIPPSVATGIAGAYLALVGASFAAGAGGRITTFRSPAEAVIMSNAGLAPLAIALWLQLRRLLASASRAFGSFAYLFVIFAPRRSDLGGTLHAFIAAMLVIALPLSAELPAFLIARGRAAGVVRIGALSFVAFGIAFAIAGFAGHRTWHALVTFVHVDPGVIVTSVFANDPKAVLIPIAVLALFVAIVAVLGGDALPELYAAAQGRFAMLQRSKSGRLSGRAREVRGGSARVPPGALALIWKDWLGFRRGLGLALSLAGAIFWAACGAGLAYVSMRLGDGTPLVAIFSFAAFAVLLAAPSTASNGLADDLSKPLFWLGRASLNARLAAWTLGRSLRGGTTLAVGPIAAAFVGGHVALALAALPLTLVAYWSLQALGIGLYAVFPSPLDARGPIALLRLLASLAYLAPAALVAVLAILLHGGPLLATLGFALTLGIQGWVVLELCALRFAEYGASLGTLSRAH